MCYLQNRIHISFLIFRELAKILKEIIDAFSDKSAFPITSLELFVFAATNFRNCGFAYFC